LTPSFPALYAILKHADSAGPTAAKSVFQKQYWWKKQVGVPFPLDDPLVAVWNRRGETHQTHQRAPLSFPAFEKFCELAMGSYTNLAILASFALLP
jgi:hypothetical protein